MCSEWLHQFNDNANNTGHLGHGHTTNTLPHNYMQMNSTFLKYSDPFFSKECCQMLTILARYSVVIPEIIVHVVTVLTYSSFRKQIIMHPATSSL